MSALLKQHALINNWVSYLTITVLIIFAYTSTLPPTFIFIVIVLSFIIMVFYYDDKNNLNRFIISLPVAKETIVNSRYLFTFIIALGVLFIQLMLMLLFSNTFTNSHYIYDWRDVIVLLCIALLIISIFLPIYYGFKSFTLATSLVVILWFVSFVFILVQLFNVLEIGDLIIINDIDPGFVLLVEKFITFQPYLVLSALTLLVLYISIKVSQYLFKRKDV